jgi:hypothetical protein
VELDDGVGVEQAKEEVGAVNADVDRMGWQRDSPNHSSCRDVKERHLRPIA